MMISFDTHQDKLLVKLLWPEQGCKNSWPKQGLCSQLPLRLEPRTTYLLVDDPKLIAWKYLTSWFVLDVASTIPSELARKLLPHKLRSYGFFNMIQLWHLRRVSALFARLEKDRHFNYFWVRYAKLICVTLFAVHCAGCLYYLLCKRNTIQAATGFAQRNQLPERLQEQMISHLSLKFRTDSEGLQQQETLDALPKAIRSSITHYLFYSLVQSVYLFHGVSNDLLFQLVSEMKAEYYPPREDVILQNEAPSDFYILVTGTAVKESFLLQRASIDSSPSPHATPPPFRDAHSDVRSIAVDHCHNLETTKTCDRRLRTTVASSRSLPTRDNHVLATAELCDVHVRKTRHHLVSKRLLPSHNHRRCHARLCRKPSRLDAL
ncbi:hypothetical protein ZIOFF_018382 [Zingiber officinale]|uniref:Cyclic nucleotide-binding domain-containing protein n=1 Tax=Zingiber officinale TaxID=94328 RepID=A0A8J5HWG9_ZINOF|nr:hypothetical protein ZIOFF_018382 [Zingiber officinale]